MHWGTGARGCPEEHHVCPPSGVGSTRPGCVGLRRGLFHGCRVLAVVVPRLRDVSHLLLPFARRAHVLLHVGGVGLRTHPLVRRLFRAPRSGRRCALHLLLLGDDRRVRRHGARGRDGRKRGVHSGPLFVRAALRLRVRHYRRMCTATARRRYDRADRRGVYSSVVAFGKPVYAAVRGASSAAEVGSLDF